MGLSGRAVPHSRARARVRCWYRRELRRLHRAHGLYESAKKHVGWPITPGSGIAGKVSALGEGVSDLCVGDPVISLTCACWPSSRATSSLWTKRRETRLDARSLRRKEQSGPRASGTLAPVLYYLFAAFYIWMIVDAIRRRAEFYWYLIIVLVPFGPVIYYLVVKLPDHRPGDGGGALARLTRREPSLSDLRYRAKETPSVVNKLALADALHGRGEYPEAAAVYRDVRSHDRDNKEALYGHSLSLMGMHRHAEAAEELHELMALDNSYRDYAAALDYGEALWQSGEHEDAVELLSGLVGVDGRINHRIALAHYLDLSGRKDEAREQLQTALGDYEHQPAFVKRRDARWAAQAEKMLRELH